MQAHTEYSSDLVLVGGGHSHALALRMLAMRPISGLRISLISPASHTPYSGMLPGLVAGHYSFEQTHIDLTRLCAWAGVNFVCATVVGLDPENRELRLQGRPSIHYDLLSIDIGSQPELDSVAGAREYAVPVKPVADFWQRWQSLQGRSAPGASLRAPEKIAVVGGGAGSVELALAMAQGLRERAADIALYCGSSELLPGYHPHSRAAAIAACKKHGVKLFTNSRVVEVHEHSLQLAQGVSAEYHTLLWCTAAAAAPWLAQSGLPVDERGFLQVTDSLQSPADQRIFAAGDCASQIGQSTPKAGVYAVRQAPVLAHNIRASLLGGALTLFRPQQRFLSLLSLGDKRATANRGVFAASGAWVWRWKDHIDQTFMRQFSQLPPMPAAPIPKLKPTADSQQPCGGCGAKVPADILSQVLTKLSAVYPQCLTANEAADDVALLPSTGQAEVFQSVDILRKLCDDYWLMGRIAANHALSDLYASGLQPNSALAVVTLPFASAELQGRDLYQLLAGALQEFKAAGCVLSGGHSMLGPELALGFVVNGVTGPAGKMLSKQGLREGDALVLTKPLGTGCLFAAQMQAKADGRDIHAAMQCMLQTNATASELALAHGASACTDITGFGLYGHTLEMLRDDQCAHLQRDAIPCLPGAQAVLEAGISSTMQAPNQLRLSLSGLELHPLDIGCDPQTSGGLLIGIAPADVEALCRSLKQQGYQSSCQIGTVERRQQQAALRF